MQGEPKRCVGRKRDGSQCGATFGLSEAGFCFSHDPERAAERRSARVAGGRATGAQSKADQLLSPDSLGELQTPADAARWLELIARAVMVGSLTERSAQAACRAVEGWLRAHTNPDTNEELQRMREEIAKLRRADLRAM